MIPTRSYAGGAKEPVRPSARNLEYDQWGLRQWGGSGETGGVYASGAIRTVQYGHVQGSPIHM